MDHDQEATICFQRENAATCHADLCPPATHRGGGRPARARQVRLTFDEHGQTLMDHSISTGGPLPCEAPSAKKRSAPESSETFIDLILPQDSSQRFPVLPAAGYAAGTVRVALPV